MANRAIILFATELTSADQSGDDYFFVYALDKAVGVSGMMRGVSAARDWATAHNAVLIDEWDEDCLTILHQVDAATPGSDLVVVKVTALGRSGSFNLNRQPKQRFWVMSAEGLIISTQPTLREAWGVVEEHLGRTNQMASEPPNDESVPPSPSGGASLG